MRQASPLLDCLDEVSGYVDIWQLGALAVAAYCRGQLPALLVNGRPQRFVRRYLGQLEHSRNFGREAGVLDFGDIPGAFICRRPTAVSKLPSGRQGWKVIGLESRIQSEE